MLIQITLQDLMLFLVCALGIIAGILLIPVLWNIKKTADILRSIIEPNQESIKRTLKTLPAITENMEQISIDIKETASKLKTTFPPILHEVEGAAIAAKEKIDMAGTVVENLGMGITEAVAVRKKDKNDFMDYVHIIEEVVQIIYRALSSGK